MIKTVIARIRRTILSRAIHRMNVQGSRLLFHHTNIAVAVPIMLPVATSP
jgi:hypothetical protein